MTIPLYFIYYISTPQQNISLMREGIFSFWLLLGSKYPVCVRIQLLSHVRLFATPWAVACQAPLPMRFSRQEYWSGLPFPSPEDLPDSGIEPVSLASPASARGFSITSAI